MLTALTLVAAVAAAIFAFPAWRDSLRRPDLRLEFDRMRGSAYWYLRIRNVGSATATG